ncbi:PKD domain-containing protein [Pseudoalteromonas sp. T1lg23B]|uniref:PKD domain-containing protein n=1 Tax=Pseudoalteromonas sp. T1lg23B TaxID=2077097 RepID=UPI00131A4503|nr:PKD domain-containing protein [Pseudoalteromonas sp. T1lg23B]
MLKQLRMIVVPLFMLLSWHVSAEGNPQGNSSEQYFWDFGDGSYSHEAQPLHQYQKPGIYQVRKLTYKNGKQVAEQNKLVDLISPNVTSLNILGPNTGETQQDLTYLVDLKAKTELDLQYFWLSSNGESHQGSQFVFTPEQTGSYQITLQAKFEQTLISEQSMQVTVTAQDDSDNTPDPDKPADDTGSSGGSLSFILLLWLFSGILRKTSFNKFTQ